MWSILVLLGMLALEEELGVGPRGSTGAHSWTRWHCSQQVGKPPSSDLPRQASLPSEA